jgi:2-dehydro-3-deoxy-D-gluconate 5-dehydrogenase
VSLSEMFSLEGKVAVVTGCRRGIGLAMAVGLAEAGADVIGVSTSMEESKSVVGQKVKEAGRSFNGYSCDFSDRKALHRFIEEVKVAHPVIDILVNNAGMTHRAPMVDHGDELWDEVIEVNQTAPFILGREFGRDMVSRGSGKIIFTASLLSFQGGITVPGYAASKAAVARLTNAFANEWAGLGVNVNALAPGYINTDLTEALQHDPVRSKAIMDRIPAGRWGAPDDFKGAVVYLASPASDYVHGTTLTVDGGWMGR